GQRAAEGVGGAAIGDGRQRGPRRRRARRGRGALRGGRRRDRDGAGHRQRRPRPGGGVDGGGHGADADGDDDEDGVDEEGGKSGPAGLVVHYALSSASQRAACLAWYVITRSAPARRMAVSDSRTAARSSKAPAAAAARSMAYSPLTQ